MLLWVALPPADTDEGQSRLSSDLCLAVCEAQVRQEPGCLPTRGRVATIVSEGV